VGDPIDNPQAWEEFNDQLPGLLDHLLASEILWARPSPAEG